MNGVRCPRCAHVFAIYGDLCPVCAEPLPQTGNRRVRIPWQGGRIRLVHADCVETVESQAVLQVEAGERRSA